MFSYLADGIAQKSEYRRKSLILVEFGGKGERKKIDLMSIRIFTKVVLLNSHLKV